MSGPGFFQRMFGADAQPAAARRRISASDEVPASGQEPAPRQVAAPTNPAPEAIRASPFGEFGEKGEKVGEQIAYFVSRLDELYGLRQEFASLATPMQDFIHSHAEAQTRLAETTALLARERADGQAVRADAHTLRAGHSRLENALGEAQARIKLHEDTAENRGAQLRNLQIAHDDASSRLDWATRQLAAEAQTGADHADAHRVMGEDLSRLEQELALERARTLELKDQHEAGHAENRRLQGLVERLQPNLATAKRRIGELETDAGANAATLGMLELKIASEQEMRRAIEAAKAQDKAAFENEVAGLALQIEALESRHATTTRIFDQSRALLNEKIEQLRHSERAAKDLQADKLVVERRHATAQDEIKRLGDQGAALSVRHQEAQERGTMLANAMAAKDAQVEQLEGRCEALKHQLEDATARYEQERVSIEGQNRKLIEEVQSERAERALAQGALSIARNSREKLQTQLEELKRNRLGRQPDFVPEEPRPAPQDREGGHNIHKFRTPEPTGDNP